MNDGRRIRYVLDTDAISALERRQPTASRRLADAAPGTVATTVITLHEQMRGRLAGVSRAGDAAALQRALGLLSETHRYLCDRVVLQFDSASAGILVSLAAQRLRIGTNDLRIAAITLANGAILVTSNRRDFERVSGLRIEDWTVV